VLSGSEVFEARFNLRLVNAGEQLSKGSSGGPPGAYAADGIVECCLIEYTDRARSFCTNGVDVLAGTGRIVRTNVFPRSAGSPTGDGGISIDYCRDFRVIHDTVVIEGSFPWAIETRFDVTTGLVATNLSDGPILERNGAMPTLQSNVESALPACFVDQAAGDLHLLPAAAAPRSTSIACAHLAAGRTRDPERAPPAKPFPSLPVARLGRWSFPMENRHEPDLDRREAPALGRRQATHRGRSTRRCTQDRDLRRRRLHPR
jgi:hypothetical protein